jgi:hypothetical protein
MNPVVITQSSTNVVITWASPSSTNGAAIIQYEVSIFNMALSQFIHNTTVCDDSILTNLNCTIAMTFFTTTYGYVPGSTIQAIARAKNVKSWGAFSAVNTVGVLAQVGPQSAP